MLKRVLLWFAGLALAGVAAAAVFVYSGFYDVAATEPHTSPGYYLLHYAMKRSVRVRADAIHVPDLSNPARLARGHAICRQHCQQCHGGPGLPPDPFARGLRPVPTNLAQDGREWPPNEVFWVVQHGVRMTAMPGWEFRLAPNEIWDVVAFVKHLPSLTPAQYQAAGAAGGPPVVAPALVPHAPDPRYGKFLVDQYMCATCHVIPGVAGADHTVGPPLAGLARRAMIAGTLPNTPENLVRWVRDPQGIRPDSAMPNLGVGEDEARHIVAFLATLEDRP